MLRKASLIFLLFSVAADLFSQHNHSTSPHPVGLSPSRQLNQYIIEVWKKERGLLQNNLTAILQSSDGYLWIGSNEGLIRFDGVEFKVFTTATHPQLKSNVITNLYEDSKKTLWIGTAGGGLTIYQKGKFSNWSQPEGLVSSIVSDIIEDEKGQLWIGTPSGLCWFNGKKFKYFTTKDGLSSREIHSFYLAQNNRLWIGTARGFTLYANGRFTDYTRQILLVNKNITGFCEDKYGNLWLGTHQGLVRWNEQKKEFKTFKTKDGLTDDYITRLYCDHFGTLWIGTQSGGLNRLLKTELNSPSPVFTNLTAKDGLSTNSITEIYQDNEGSLWIGTVRGGLNRLYDGKFVNFTTLQGLSDNIVNCVFEDQAGALWIGTVNAGVSYYANGKFTVINKEKGLNNNYVRSITQDNQGNTWLGTYGGGLAKIENNKIIHFTTEKGLTGNLVRAVLADKKGNIWAATRTGLSKLIRQRDGGYEIQNYTKNLGLADNLTTCLLQDSKNHLWVGTETGGLSCIRSDNSIINFNSTQNLASNCIYALYEDAQGTMWVGTKDGLSVIREGTIKNIFTKDGLPAGDVHSLLEDEEGRFWMSSKNGIFWVKKSGLEQFISGKIKKIEGILYQEQDGMKNSECAVMTQPAALKDKAGKLWFPTSEGIVMIDPRELKINQRQPQVVIKRIIADGEEFDIYQKLKFTAGKSKFEIDYAALSFIASQKINYKYRLIGDNFKESWVEAGNKREAYYTNLPPGKYTFQVIAANHDGIWNETGTQLEFYLEPYFYQTRFFYILSAFLFVSFGFGVYYLRVGALERSKQALERGIAESTLKIKTQYEEINKQAEELETINTIVRTINDEVKLENVLKALLEQGLLLFSESHKGVLLLHQPQNVTYQLVFSQGYETQPFSKKVFSKEEILEYCETGLLLEEDIYALRPAINFKVLMKDYRPKSSIAMLITVEQELEAVIFFDNDMLQSDVSFSDVKKLVRFKEHAVTAFAKAHYLSEIEAKSEALESSYRKISDSIRYARRIQKAIMGEPEDILRHFKEAFIFYEPKNIVSGDFYWFEEPPAQPIFAVETTGIRQTSVFKGFENPQIILAAVDCTGHGVPGAFMTVIGNDLLTSIVLEEKIIQPDKILAALDRKVKKYLKQEEGSLSKDGMDIALVLIDEIENKIQFAGAKNPLVRFSKGQMQLIKGSKDSIGGAQRKSKEFEQHCLQYEEGDVFYLYSDGFQDQFGGMNDRKYTSKKFLEFLTNIHTQPMEVQKELLARELNEWKGESKQTDDVLVIGFKF